MGIPYIPIGFLWNCSNQTKFTTLVKMSFTDPPPGGLDTQTCVQSLRRGVRFLLRSAVGKTHVLWSGLWWTIPLPIFIDCLGIPLGSQPIRLGLARHSGVQVPVISRHGVMWSFLDQSQSSLRNFRQKAGIAILPVFCQSRLVPSSSYLRVYMGCALAFVLQVRSLYVPWHMVHS